MNQHDVWHCFKYKAKRGEDEYSNKQLWQNKDDLGNNKLVTIN